MNASALGPVLAVWRETSGLDQVGLAKKLACSQAQISRLESGKALVTVPFLIRWCAALDVELEIKIGPRRKK